MKALLFDFFGTLVDYSESRVEQGYSRSYGVLRANGADIGYEEFLSHWSRTFDELEADATQTLREYSMDDVCSRFLSRVLGAAPRAALVEELRDRYLEEWSTSVRYIAGVTELLASLARDFTLVLVTNTHHARLVQSQLRQMHVAHCFSAVVTSVEHGYRKPSASIFEHALGLIQASSQDAIFVGDSFAADYQGAVRAGMRGLLIDPNRRYPIPEEDRLRSVLELRVRLEDS